MKALHVRFEGFTAFYRMPFLASGTLLSLPAPPYCSILGMLGACVGRELLPSETRIGFEYHCRSSGNIELERTVRWKVDKKKAILVPNPEQGLTYREIHYAPRLDVYLTNPELRAAFARPAGTPSFGRSQDIAWITLLREIDLGPVEQGRLGPTLMPSPQMDFGGRILPPIAQWFENDRLGYTRRLGNPVQFQVVPESLERVFVRRRQTNVKLGNVRKTVTTELYHPSDSDRDDDAVYLHEWI